MTSYSAYEYKAGGREGWVVGTFLSRHNGRRLSGKGFSRAGTDSLAGFSIIGVA